METAIWGSLNPRLYTHEPQTRKLSTHFEGIVTTDPPWSVEAPACEHGGLLCLAASTLLGFRGSEGFVFRA